MPQKPIDIDASFSMIRWPDNDTGPWGIRANWVMLNGRPECVGLVIWRGADQAHQSPMQYHPHGVDTLRPITATGIDELPIATIIDKLRVAARDHWRQNAQDIARLFPHWDADDPRREPYAVFEQPNKARPGAPTKYGPEHFADVARVYLSAWRDSRNPTQAVADHFSASRSAAAKWVTKCRALGLLTPAEHGRGGAAPGPALKQQSAPSRKRGRKSHD